MKPIHHRKQALTVALFRQWLLAVVLLLSVNPAAQAAGQQNIPDYATARTIFWQQLSNQGGTSLYCGQRYQGRRHRGLNIEHVFPMSWVTRSLRCGRRKQCRKRSPQFNRIEADLHNLYPAMISVNKARSSFSFGLVKGEKRRFQRCDFEVNESKRIAEPRPAVRGNIARAMFYMSYTYHLPLYRRQMNLLLTWHRQDPPDRAEKRRNSVIEKLEGIRNPFIDRPDSARAMLTGKQF